LECYYFDNRALFFSWVTFLVDGVKYDTRTATSGDYEVIYRGTLEWRNFRDDTDRMLCSTIASAAKSGKKIS